MRLSKLVRSPRKSIVRADTKEAQPEERVEQIPKNLHDELSSVVDADYQSMCFLASKTYTKL